jgi:hypothetical protein
MLRRAAWVQFSSGSNPMYVDHVHFPVNGIENAPVTDGILDDTG